MIFANGIMKILGKVVVWYDVGRAVLYCAMSCCVVVFDVVVCVDFLLFAQMS